MVYDFIYTSRCNMCGSDISNHKILGQRLNKSQGYNPKKKFGISTTICQCDKCSLIYPNPLPIPNDISDHYGVPPENYWVNEYFEVNENYFIRVINKFKSLYPFEKGMKALDIGAGIGKCMVALNKAGFDAYGLEPSEPFRNKAIEKMGINAEKLKLGMMEELDYEEKTFDFITFGAVLEHLYDPSLCISKALDWLKPNGLLHIEVPSSRYLLPKFFNIYFKLRVTNYVNNLSPMHEPFHLYEFDLKSFILNGEKMGYKVVAQEYMVGDIYFIPKIFHPILRWYMKITNKGMQLEVWLKKTNKS